MKFPSDTMGTKNGKPGLSEEDLKYISENTAASIEQVKEQYQLFLKKHDDNEITRKDLTKMLKVRSRISIEERLREDSLLNIPPNIRKIGQCYEFFLNINLYTIHHLNII